MSGAFRLLVFLCLVVIGAAVSAADESGGELPTGGELLRRFFEGNGGRPAFDAVKTLRIAGRIEGEGGASAELILTRKQPNLLRYRVTYANGLRITTGYDGRVAWQRTEAPGGNAEIEVLEGPGAARVAYSAPFWGQMVALRDDPARIRPIEWTTPGDGDEPALNVAIDSPGGPVSTFTLSNALDKVMRIRVPDGDLMLDSRYSDFELHGGVWIARRVEEFKDGERTSVVTVSKIESNVGIFDSFFAKPVY